MKYYKQYNLQDCGVASILTVMKHYNMEVKSETLRDLTKTTKEGTSAFHIIKALKKFNFEAHGYRCSFENLKNIKTPAIIHLNIEKKYNHFVVLKEVKKDKVAIIDPVIGYKKIRNKEFKEQYTENVIEAFPIIKFPIREEKVIKKEIKSLKINYTKTILTSITVILISILNSYYFMLMMRKIDLTSAFLIMIITKIIIETIREKEVINIKEKIDKKVTEVAFSRIIKLPYKYYSSRTTGEVISRINDLEIVKTFLTKFYLIVFLDIPLTVISLLFLFNISKYLLLASTITYLVYLAIYFLFSKKIKEKIEELKEEKARMNAFMTEMISAYETIKAQGLEEIIIEKFKKINGLLIKKIKKFDQLLSKEYHLKELVTGFSSIVIIYLGFRLIDKNLISIEELITFNFILFFYFTPIKNIIEFDSDLKEYNEAIIKIEELFYSEEEIDDEEIASGDIDIKNLCYSYDDIENVFENLNLSIKMGEKILITGESGKGKSTFLKIILKYLTDYSGTVYVNKKNIDKYNIRNYIKGISYISQKETLFNDTIANNLYSSDLVKIKEMSKICNLDEFIEKNTLDKVIDENTFNISGGEKQRLVLLRAILRDFNFLIIDEGLSALDLKSEQMIIKNLFEKFKEKTIIVISHRMENKFLFDKIYNF